VLIFFHSELPRIGSTALKRGPFGSSLKKEFFVSKGYKVYEQQNAINDDNNLGGYYIDESKYKELKAFSIHPGDYIVSCSGTIGKISILPEDTEPGIINQALLRIRIDERIITHSFFQYFFKSMYLQSKILVDSRGTGMKNLAGVKELRIINLFLPPLPEQRVIVSKIEQLFSDLDNGIENFEKAQEQLKRYRQAVLKKAFEGKLVPNEAELARTEGKDYEPADELMVRILKERREKWNGKGKYKEPSVPDISGLQELPVGWGWGIIKAISEIIMGQSPPGKSYNIKGAGVPLINGPVEFGPNPFSKTNRAKFTTAPTKMCKENDLILCVRGSTTGRMNIAGFDACIGRGVAAIRGFIDQWYLNYYIHFNEKNFLNMGTGSTFPNISSNQVAEYFIPLPPLTEQRRIVVEVENRLLVCDKLKRIR